jgi:hypothetical protein
MAKVPFSKLQACVNGSDCTLNYCNKAGEEIKYEVKHYLPFAEKLDLVSRVINQSIDDNGFYNPMRVKLYMTLEVVYAYTNLSFTDKMKDDPFKLYDILVSTGIFTDIINAINENDWKEIQDNVWSTIKNIYEYRNSMMGIMEAISSDYADVSMDVNALQSQLANTENLGLLKDILTKLG